MVISIPNHPNWFTQHGNSHNIFVKLCMIIYWIDFSYRINSSRNITANPSAKIKWVSWQFYDAISRWFYDIPDFDVIWHDIITCDCTVVNTHITDFQCDLIFQDHRIWFLVLNQAFSKCCTRMKNFGILPLKLKEEKEVVNGRH